MIRHPFICPLEDVVGFYRDVMTLTDPDDDDYTEIWTVNNDLNWFEVASEFL